ncbi:MAG: diacylglycerol/lipid kinase family protein, partial [Dorea sp.]
KSLEPVIQECNVEYKVYFTKYQTHATKLVAEITSELDHCTLVVLGGDGTINEVVNGITDLSKVTLGYIPIGSSNDFARSLRLSTDAMEALNCILKPTKYMDLNIGTIQYKNKKRRFAVSAGMGFDAGVCHEVVISKLKVFFNKLHLGKLTYMAVALRQLAAQNPRPLTVILDDQKKIEFKKAYFATAMNNKYEGGGFKFCPKARPDDDILDIIVAADISKLKILFLLPTALAGLHVYIKGIYVYQCKKAEFISEKALPLHTDGEPVFLQSQMCTSLEPEKIRLILT